MNYLRKIVTTLLLVFFSFSSFGAGKTKKQLTKEKQALELKLSALKGKKGTANRRKRAKLKAVIKDLKTRIDLIKKPVKKTAKPDPFLNLPLQEKNIKFFGQLQAFLAGKKKAEIKRINFGTPENRSKLTFSEKTIKKYGGLPKISQFTNFTKESLADLRDIYLRVPGLPRFLEDFINGRPSQHRLGIYRFPHLYEFWDCQEGSLNCTVLMPNPSYIDHDIYFLANKEHEHFNNLRLLPGGFALVTWNISHEQYPLSEEFKTALQSDNTKRYRTAIDNHFPDLSRFSTKITKPNFYPARHSLLRRGYPQERLDLSRELSDSSDSSDSDEKINLLDMRRSVSGSGVSERSQPQIERHNSKNNKTYASILDLTKSDVAWLKRLKKRLLQHLKRTYNVKPSTDQIRIYFHFPYSEVTVTLHTHVRVNQAVHPLEASRSFMLDEIIQRLEGSTDDAATGLNMGIVNMIIERTQTGFFSSMFMLDQRIIKNFSALSEKMKVGTPVRLVDNVLQVPRSPDGNFYQGTDEEMRKRLESAIKQLNSQEKDGGGRK